jgi:hypothetical protein
MVASVPEGIGQDTNIPTPAIRFSQ